MTLIDMYSSRQTSPTCLSLCKLGIHRCPIIELLKANMYPPMSFWCLIYYIICRARDLEPLRFVGALWDSGLGPWELPTQNQINVDNFLNLNQTSSGLSGLEGARPPPDPGTSTHKAKACTYIALQ